MNKVFPSGLAVGIFDHLDEDGLDIARQYEDRLMLAEACDRLRFYAYHLAEHHCTPHGRGPSPNLFLSSVVQRTRRPSCRPLGNAACALSSGTCVRRDLYAGPIERWQARTWDRARLAPDRIGLFGIGSDAAPDHYAETSEILMNALKGGTLSYQGRHFELNSVPLTLRTHQRPTSADLDRHESTRIGSLGRCEWR